MRVGVIGTGNMGSILIQAMIESQAIPPSQLSIMNRTKSKAEKLQRSFPEVTVEATPIEIAKTCEVIFVCVKPHEIYPLLLQINSELTADKCIVSITSPVSIKQLEKVTAAQAARMIPSITNRALSGVTLLTFGETIQAHHKKALLELASHFSKPVVIEEAVTRVASDIVSCGPAFVSFLLQRFIDAAASQTPISREQAVLLCEEMIIGFGRLIEKEIFTLETLQETVCVKGGVTGEGIAVLEQEIGEMFEHLFNRTHDKFKQDKKQTLTQFGIN